MKIKSFYKIMAVCFLGSFFCMQVSAQDIPDGSALTVKTGSGTIRGMSHRENTVAWLGIPYAKPPVGGLRWKAPRDPDPWEGIRDADKFCSFCMQRGNIFSATGEDTYGKEEGMGSPAGSEDCLYLNVFKPKGDTANLPVFVFIHGGANILGRSDMSLYDGARLASKANIIVVTLNYRLGYMGWFTLPQLREGDKLDDSGNYGTLDIIKALGWVKNNISGFGGNPGNVTIAGQSAGAMNVYSMLASPLAKGLFHKAVIMSGLSQSCSMETAQKKSEDFLYELMIADKTAKSISDAKEIIFQKGDAWVRQYLISKKAADFYDLPKKRSLAVSSNGVLKDRSFMGIYEDGYVIPKSPLEAFRSWDYNRVPIMMGCTTQEFRLFIPMIFYPPKDIAKGSAHFDPDNPNLSLGCIGSLIACPLECYMDRLSLRIFRKEGVETMAGLASNHQEDVYVYLFGWNNEPEPFNHILGAAHSVDLAFWFGNFDKGKDSLFGMAWSKANEPGRMKLADTMIAYLANFVSSGNPNSERLPAWDPWPKVPGKYNRMFLSGEKVEMTQD
jgi:para-nitrobenzyl esterase